MIAKQVESSGDLVLPAGTRVYGLRLESVSDDCTAIIYNDITQALGATNNKEICKLCVTNIDSTDKHPASDQIMFGGNGVDCSVGISVTLTGTTPDLYIYYA